MFYSRSLTTIALIGMLGLINGAPLLAEQKQEPLYLHWFSLGKPNSSHVATLRVYPNQEFELALGLKQAKACSVFADFGGDRGGAA
jgi:hypothetical protein